MYRLEARPNVWTALSSDQEPAVALQDGAKMIMIMMVVVVVMMIMMIMVMIIRINKLSLASVHITTESVWAFCELINT